MLKGLFLHSAAKVIFVLCTYIIHLYLGKTLSSSEYGVIGVVLSVITLNYNFLSNGARQSVAKNLALKVYDERDLVNKSIITQGIISIILMLLNWALAGTMAQYLNASSMAYYIKVSALMIPFTGFYFIFVGIVNGLKLFVTEAAIVSIYPILRVTVIPYVKFVFSDSALGTVAGFFTAAFICCIIGAFIFIVKIIRNLKINSNKITLISFFKSMGSYLSFFTCVTLLLNVDMLFVNAFVQDADSIGYYTGAVNFAKVSYYLLSAFYIVVLPVVTTYYSVGKIHLAQKKINTLLNTILLVILPVVTIVGASAGNLLASFYKPEYRVADNTALLLMISQFLIGLFVVCNMCITATQEKLFSAILALITVILDCTLCYFLIPLFGILGAAQASAISGLFGFFITFYKLNKIYGRFYDLTSVKLIICNVIYFANIKIISSLWKIENLVLLFIYYIIAYILFIFLIQVLKVINIKKLLYDVSHEIL